MKYQLSSADRRPAPPKYASEPRYLGYRSEDETRPFAPFFEPRVAPVQSHVVEALAYGRFPAEFGYTVEDAARRMSAPGYESMETGYCELEGGRIQVSVLTRMPGVRAEMWDWWFGWHGTDTARYKLWHPEAHYFSAVGEDRTADRTLSDRQRYIGNVSYVDEYLGADKSQLTVRFLEPTKLGFEESRSGSTVIAARGGLSPAPVAFAWLIHQLRPTEEGCEMRSRFFVNDTELLRLPPASLTSKEGAFLTTPVGRAVGPSLLKSRAAKADHFGPAMVMHCAQEMNHLARFLPALHEAFVGTP